MTTTPESLLEQVRAIWPISWELESRTLIGTFEAGNVDLCVMSSEFGWFIGYGKGAWAYPSSHSNLPIDTVVRFLRDAWWDWFSQQEGAISDLEQQVLADSIDPPPLVWLRLQQIKQREADKHRMMVRVDRRRIWDMKASILAIVRSYEAGEISTLEPVIEVLRGLIPEHCQEGDAL